MYCTLEFLGSIKSLSQHCECMCFILYTGVASLFKSDRGTEEGPRLEIPEKQNFDRGGPGSPPGDEPDFETKYYQRSIELHSQPIA